MTHKERVPINHHKRAKLLYAWKVNCGYYIMLFAESNCAIVAKESSPCPYVTETFDFIFSSENNVMRRKNGKLMLVYLASKRTVHFEGKEKMQY